ncbi:MAG: hypothetical protein ACRD4Q_02615 [Candidatus Acidiferrales bacterium]
MACSRLRRLPAFPLAVALAPVGPLLPPVAGQSPVSGNVCIAQILAQRAAAKGKHLAWMVRSRGVSLTLPAPMQLDGVAAPKKPWGPRRGRT